MNGTVRAISASHLHHFRGTRGNVSLLGSLGIGTAIAVGVAVLFWVAKFAVPYIYELHYQRGPIPFITTELFGIALAIVFLKYRNLGRERSMFQRDYLKRIIGEVPAGDGTELTVEQSDADQYVLPARVARALQVFRKTRSTTEVGTALSEASALDSDLLSSSYFLVNFLTWMIPILGFLGTVIGVSMAIGEFRTIMGEQGQSAMESMRLHIGTITGGLALAFDTTLQALSYAAVVKLASSSLLKMDEDFLSGVDRFCMDKLVPHLRQMLDVGTTPGTGGDESDQLMRAVLTSLNKIESRMGTGLPPEIGEVLRAIASDLHFSKDVITAASSLKEVLTNLTQTLKAMQESTSANQNLSAQVGGLGKLMAEIYGRQWPSRT
jgi:hypothetical protein